MQKTIILKSLIFSLLLSIPSFILAMQPSATSYPTTYATTHDAAQAGDLQYVAKQLQKYAQRDMLNSVINGYDNQGHTLLTRALMGANSRVDNRNNGMAKLLLECKSDPNQTTQAGESPIRIALDGGNFGGMDLLQEYGADTPGDVPAGLMAGLQSLFITIQTQATLIKAQGADLVRLERELDACHDQLANQGYASSDAGSDSGVLSEQEEELDNHADNGANSYHSIAPTKALKPENSTGVKQKEQEEEGDPDWELVVNEKICAYT